MSQHRLSALLLLLIVLATLGTQFALNGARPGLEPWAARLWFMIRHFTILTCGLVGVLMACEAFGRKVGANWHASATISIILVGVIYQLFLAPPEPLTGIEWWSDFGRHAAIPVLTVVWWVGWAPKPLALKSLPLWLLWPVAYCVYALIRGVVSGQYAYFFIDVDLLGAAQVALNIVAMVTAFSLVGLLAWVAARILPSR